MINLTHSCLITNDVEKLRDFYEKISMAILLIFTAERKLKNVIYRISQMFNLHEGKKMA